MDRVLGGIGDARVALISSLSQISFAIGYLCGNCYIFSLGGFKIRALLEQILGQEVSHKIPIQAGASSVSGSRISRGKTSAHGECYRRVGGTTWSGDYKANNTFD
jgi:hypothetical protein